VFCYWLSIAVLCSLWDRGGAKNAFLEPFLYQFRSFYQDRLGTNVGKTPNKEGRFSQGESSSAEFLLLQGRPIGVCPCVVWPLASSLACLPRAASSIG
jgi:hypothetical protein